MKLFKMLFTISALLVGFCSVSTYAAPNPPLITKGTIKISTTYWYNSNSKPVDGFPLGFIILQTTPPNIITLSNPNQCAFVDYSGHWSVQCKKGQQSESAAIICLNEERNQYHQTTGTKTQLTCPPAN